MNVFIRQIFKQLDEKMSPLDAILSSFSYTIYALRLQDAIFTGQKTDTVTNQIQRQAAVKLYVAGKLDSLTK